ncbi:uncharacterized protein SRS1_10412 [Sporisorium reilianum f. sp. reilianum]|uniref:Uncharacterized protein n=1 Tax=Sporisorium reilianum f. sp. reilianum TaxID=72559 RepID=A0A2N8UAN3_9BASI|nr:uncharacterized protein SRS1_10412 [Sporisorium reilianum f. sp. reilianum]
MSNGNAAQARQQGADGDGLNLPSFRDLVAFQRADADDRATLARHHREHVEIDASPRGSLEKSFEVVAIKRAPHHHRDQPTASSARQHIDRDGGHDKYVQDRGGTHQYSQGHRAVDRDPRDDFATHFRAREATAREQHHDARNYAARDHQAHETYRTGRIDERMPSRQDDIVRERAPTSQEMVRSSKAYQPSVSYPPQRLPAATSDNVHPSDRPRSTNAERRPVPTQPVPSQGATSFPRPPQHSPAPDHPRTHGDRNAHNQRQSAAAPTRISPHDKEPYRDYRTLEHLDRRSLPPSPQIVDARRAQAGSGSLGQTPSPRLPMPRSQGRMFDYSCARLPVESRGHASAANMGPPPSSFRVVHASAGSSVPVDRTRERDGGRQRVSSHPQAYPSDHGVVYQQRHSGYGEDARGRTVSSVERLSDKAIQERSHELERARMQVVEASLMPRAISADARRGDSPLHRDQRSLHSGSPHRACEPRASPVQREGQLIRPVQAVAIDHHHSARPSPSDSPRLVRARDDYERPSRTVVRHTEDAYPPRTSTNGHQHDAQESRPPQRERIDDKQFYALLQQQEQDKYERRALRSSPPDAFERRSASVHESRRSDAEPRYRDQAPAQRVPSASPGFPPRETQVERVLNAVRRYDDGVSREAVRPVQENGGERRREREAPSMRELVHMELAQMELSRNAREEAVFSSRSRRGEEYQSARNAAPEYSRSSRIPAGYEPMPQQAAVHGAGRPSPEHVVAPTPAYRYDNAVQHPSRGTGEHMHRVSPPQPPRARERDTDHARPRYLPAQADTAKDTADRPSFHDAHHAPAAQPRPPPKPRALPPVIASQHTSVQPPRTTAEPSPPAPIPVPAARPLKRHRADSDTSLVLKASRFAMVEHEDAARPSSGRVVLPSPPRVAGARETGHRRHGDRVERAGDGGVAVVEGAAKRGDSSAPITPPRSSG